MTHYLDYMENPFSNELKLLVQLSQEQISIDSDTHMFLTIDWEVFIQLVLKHRLVSHVLKNLNRNPDIIPQKIINKLKEINRNQSRTALSYSSYILALYNKFNHDKIPHVFFKGPLLSVELYNNIGFRNFRDIDILIEKKSIEKARKIIEDLGFTCIYPTISLTNIQKKVNYRISHHYDFRHKTEPVNIELHWSISNPKSFFSISTNEIIANSNLVDIASHKLPYISKVYNLIYLASHGSIHQWYRLFWLKDFSVLLRISKHKEIKEAFVQSKKLKLHKPFVQACLLSQIIFNVVLPDFIPSNINSNLIRIPIHSISSKELRQQGILGKFKFVFYRLQLKQDFAYYFELLYRLRTHLTDWELLKLPPSLFFLYYILRPFLLIYKFMFRK